MRTVVGVLRGGPSNEYEVSLRSGAAVLEALNKDKYDARDIFIDRTGAWHSRGVAADPARALAGVDVAFNTIHGEYGEDGRLHQVLDPLGIPYTGPDKLSSIQMFNKARTKDAVLAFGVKVAHGLVVEPAGDIEELAHRLFRSFPHPAVVKPVIGGSSVGVSVVRTYHDLAPALLRAAAVSPKVLIEEFIPGREATVGVIDEFRGEPTYALIPEPNTFSQSEKDQLTALAKQVHRELGLRHFSHSDFIVSKRGIYFIEVNALPKLHQDSVFVRALDGVGAKLSHVVEHVVELARRR